MSRHCVRLQGALYLAMAKEIERKFLVADGAWRESAEASIAIRQFYVAGMAGRSVRVRIRDDQEAMLTLKFGGHGPERDEFEYPIPLEDAKDMVRFALGNVIEKTRHHVRYKGRLFEVDVFEGVLSGLTLAELETDEAVPSADLPPWLGRDVTDHSRYYNASLAIHGLPGDA